MLWSKLNHLYEPVEKLSCCDFENSQKKKTQFEVETNRAGNAPNREQQHFTMHGGRFMRGQAKLCLCLQNN